MEGKQGKKILPDLALDLNLRFQLECWRIYSLLLAF